MTVAFSAPTGRQIIAQGKAQRRPGLVVHNLPPALKGRQKSCVATIRNFQIVQTEGGRQLVTPRHQLNIVHRSDSQLVTNCDQLKTGRFRTCQPVTNCNRLKTPPNQRSLITPP